MMATVVCDRGKDEHEAGELVVDTHCSSGGTSKLPCFYSLEEKAFFHAAMVPDGSPFAIVEMPFKHPKTEKLDRNI